MSASLTPTSLDKQQMHNASKLKLNAVGLNKWVADKSDKWEEQAIAKVK